MNHSLAIFIQFLKRDLHVFCKNINRYFINYSIIYPVLYSLTFGYIIPVTNLANAHLVSISLLLPSSMIFLFLTLNMNQNIFMLLDLESSKYIEFQATLLKPKFIILEKVCISGILTTIFLLPFFAVSKLILQNAFDTTNLSIFKLLIIISLTSFTIASYVIFSILNMKDSHHIGNWWRRINAPLNLLGGSWVPWFTMLKVSTTLGIIALLNPFIYVTEGLRGAILGTDLFISFIYCVFALLLFTFIFINLAIKKLKKRIDCF